MVDALDWAAAPQRSAAPADTTLAGEAAVRDLGGRVLCEQADVAYDQLDAAAQTHYQSMAWAIFLAMWDSAIEHNVTVGVEHVTPAGEPIEQELNP